MAYHPRMLVILDGFGHADPGPSNAISCANKPHFDYWLRHYPHTYLAASGKAVGLPPGFIGNSEVGHETIGAGRIIKQPLTIMNEAIARGTLARKPLLQELMQCIAAQGKALHIMGLLSDAGVHSYLEHLFFFLKLAKQYGIKRTYIHVFLDGRDVAPQSAQHFLQRLDDIIAQERYGSIASLQGRFYAMDRDNNWDRTMKSFDALVGHGDLSGESVYATWRDALEYYYAQGITDEFIPPTRLHNGAAIADDDGVLSINFRADRMRQLTTCFVHPERLAIQVNPPKISCFITPFLYATTLPTQVLFTMSPVVDTLKEVLSAHGKSIFTIAETEKYAHITYFFNGEKEDVLAHEHRELIPSIKAKTYVEHPCMSAPRTTSSVVQALQEERYDFFLINYANADMVGHSGSIPATIKAIECLDKQLGILYEAAVKRYHGTMLVTADHGNAEMMWDPSTDQPHTAHTTNPVPCILLDEQLFDSHEQLPLKDLADIAPYLLRMMGITPPALMRHE
ncbi:2,3-bisphosphoglycerate-independent phosphoglycerate mutase [Candidatus Dependentiae bacterium]|nr:2,3-bisphosphoglycerate-independent phosphoglycerate mutase [Candidatus Dependentiae bacterium]